MPVWYQGTPGEGSLRRKRPPDISFYPPALLKVKEFRVLWDAPRALPFDPTTFFKRWTKTFTFVQEASAAQLSLRFPCKFSLFATYNT